MTLLTDILTTFAASSIAHVGEVDVDGERARTSIAPRYEIDRIAIRPVESDIAPLSAKGLGVDEHEIEVHCWADSEESAERMRQAAVYMMRQACGNVAHCFVGNAVWKPTEDASLGCTLTVSMSIHIPLPVPVLPTSLATPFVSPSSSVTDYADTYKVITSAKLEDTSPTTGNNTLEIGDT